MVDRILLDKIYQPIADKVMDLTLLSCFWLAGQAAITGFLSACIITLSGALQQGPSLRVWLLVGLDMMIGLGSLFMWKEAEKEQRRTDAGTMTLRVDTLKESFYRKLWLTFFCLDIMFTATDAVLGALSGAKLIGVLGHVGFSGSFLSYYSFMACRPKPPRRKRAHVPVWGAT